MDTNGGLMYYQYDGRNSVTELTDRNGNEIEHYRYDAFGGIYTGITAPYNTTGYTGQEYDDKSGLVQMDARWYNPDIGRFMTQDSYQGDIYNPQSLNQYSYVMNNPVNMWDPTGHVPSWVGQGSYLTTTPDGTHAVDLYVLQSSSSSSSDWYLIDKITSASQIVYKYKATVNHSWTYSHDHWQYKTTTDPETGETNYEVTSHTTGTSSYSETDYYYKDVVVKASEIAHENEQYIKNLAGAPPKNTDPPAVSISTLQVNGGPVKLLNPDEIILRNTGTKTSGPQKLVAGVVQSELNDIFNTKLTVDEWYGSQTAGTLKDLQKELSLPRTGVLDAQTFYQLEMAYENGAKYKRSVSKTNYTRASTKTKVGSTSSTDYNVFSTVPGDYNGNNIPDQYERHDQGQGNSASNAGGGYNPHEQRTGSGGYQYASDYRSYLTDPQGTGNGGNDNRTFWEQEADSLKENWEWIKTTYNDTKQGNFSKIVDENLDPFLNSLDAFDGLGSGIKKVVKVTQEAPDLIVGAGVVIKKVFGNNADEVIEGAGEAANAGKKFTPDQQALVDLAKEAKKSGSVTPGQADALMDWAKEYNLPGSHGPEVHPNRPGPASNQPHIHIGPVGHLPIEP